MLVLTRGIGESIVIGDQVIVTVLEVRGRVVRVGLQAPGDVRIQRYETWELTEQQATALAAAGY